MLTKCAFLMLLPAMKFNTLLANKYNFVDIASQSSWFTEEPSILTLIIIGFRSYMHVWCLLISFIHTYIIFQSILNGLVYFKLPLKVIALIECLTAILESIDLISSGHGISLPHPQNSIIPPAHYIKVVMWHSQQFLFLYLYVSVMY